MTTSRLLWCGRLATFLVLLCVPALTLAKSGKKKKSASRAAPVKAAPTQTLPPAQPSTPSTGALSAPAVEEAQSERVPSGSSVAPATASKGGGAAAPSADEAVTPLPTPRSRLQALHLRVFVSGLNRRLSYTDDLFGRFMPYQLGFAPGAGLEAEYFPGAHLSQGPAAWFGISAYADVPFVSRATDPSGRVFSSFVLRAGGALAFRYPISMFELLLHAGVDVMKYGFTEALTPPVGSPIALSITHLSARPMLGVRVHPVERLSIDVRVAYLFLVNGGGEVATLFARTSGGALDARLALSVSVTSFLAVYAGVQYNRYFYAFGSKPGDRYVAGGALDELISARLGVEFLLF